MDKEQEFLNACLAGDSRKVARMLTENPDLIKEVGTYIPHSSEVVTSRVDNVSALILAVISSDRATVEAVIKGKPNIDQADSNGHTALVWAITYSDADVVACLLKAGAKSNTVDKRGCTPKQIALNLAVSSRGEEGRKAKEAVMKLLSATPTAVLSDMLTTKGRPEATATVVTKPIVFTKPGDADRETAEGNYPAGSRLSARHLTPVSTLAAKFGGTSDKAPEVKKEVKEEVESTTAAANKFGVTLRSTSTGNKLW